MLSGRVSDALAIFGAVGTLATLVGLALTYWQSRKATGAAEAAEHAAKEALEADKSQFKQYMVSNAHRFINEAEIFVRNGDWHMAATRMGDLADQTAQVASTSLDSVEWEVMTKDLRQWKATFSKVAVSKLTFSRTSRNKWHIFVAHVSGRIDQFYGPYTEQAGSVSHDS